MTWNSLLRGTSGPSAEGCVHQGRVYLDWWVLYYCFSPCCIFSDMRSPPGYGQWGRGWGGYSSQDRWCHRQCLWQRLHFNPPLQKFYFSPPFFPGLVFSFWYCGRRLKIKWWLNKGKPNTNRPYGVRGQIWDSKIILTQTSWYGGSQVYQNLRATLNFGSKFYPDSFIGRFIYIL